MMKIIIADDHSVVRRGIREIIQDAYSDAMIEEVNDSESLISKIIMRQWDLVICDLSMPGRSGLDALLQIHQSHPDLPVIILSIHPEEQYAVRAFKSGAMGYLNKQAAPDELIKAIEKVMSGKKYITQPAAEKLFDLIQSSNVLPHEKLSDREFEVFKLLADGKSTSQIASQLNVSTTTISTYRSRILEKMKFNSNADLTKYALQHKLL